MTSTDTNPCPPLFHPRGSNSVCFMSMFHFMSLRCPPQPLSHQRPLDLHTQQHFHQWNWRIISSNVHTTLLDNQMLHACSQKCYDCLYELYEPLFCSFDTCFFLNWFFYHLSGSCWERTIHTFHNPDMTTHQTCLIEICAFQISIWTCGFYFSGYLSQMRSTQKAFAKSSPRD